MKNLLLILLCFCAGSIAIAQGVDKTIYKTKNPLPSDTEIRFAMEDTDISVPYEVIGFVEQSILSYYQSYSTLINNIKKATRKAGGNLFKITEFHVNFNYAPEYEIKGYILYTDSLELQKTTPLPIEFEYDVDFAILHFFRYPGNGPDVKVKTLDSLLCTLPPGKQQTIHLRKQDRPYIIAQTKKRDILIQEFEAGREYYIRVYTKANGAPKLEIINWLDGKMEVQFLIKAGLVQNSDQEFSHSAPFEGISDKTDSSSTQSIGQGKPYIKPKPEPINYYASGKNSPMLQHLEKKTEPKSLSYSWKINIGFGLSTHTDASHNEFNKIFDKHIKELKTGGHLQLSTTGFINKKIGIGLLINHMHSSSSLKNLYVEIDNYYLIFDYDEELSNSFIAPTIIYREIIKNSYSSFQGGIAIGYFRYFNQAKIITADPDVNSTIKTTGNSIGIRAILGFDIGLSKKTALNLSASYLHTKINKVNQTINGVSKENNFQGVAVVNPSRFDFSIGLSIRF